MRDCIATLAWLVAFILATYVQAAPPPAPPFSFKCDGQEAVSRLKLLSPAGAPIGRWQVGNNGVVAVVQRTEMPEFSAAEWTFRLTNPASGPSPLLTEIWSGDFDVEVDPSQPPQLFSAEGSAERATDFQPQLQTLEQGKTISLESFGGRSSDGSTPFFNVFGGKTGAIIGVGWTGNWRAQITATEPGKVRVRVGMQNASFKLEGKESVRLPSVLVMKWTGERIAGHNQFRRLIMAHYTPQHAPPMELAPIATSPHVKIAFSDVNEANLLDFVRRMHEANVGVDTLWLDAGWQLGGFAGGQGNPEPDPLRLPHGLKPVADLTHSFGYRWLQWFEPERAMVNTVLPKEHPDWMLKPSGCPPRIQYQEKDGFRLVDLGNPAAYKWTLEYLTRHIRSTGIDIYRQDCNIYPSFFWHTDEPTDRVGIREIRYIENEYNLLDTLQKRFPKLIIDNCASGGRRLDFEMMRRSIPYFRSDYIWGHDEYPRSAQTMNLAISYWLPMSGNGTIDWNNLAVFAAGMGAPFPSGVDYTNQKELDQMRFRITQLKRVRRYFAEDFYPLTDWSLDVNKPVGVQYHDPKTDSGFLMVFGKSIDISQIKPQGLKSSAYEWSDWTLPDAHETVASAETNKSGLVSLDHQNIRHDVVVMEYHAANQPKP